MGFNAQSICEGHIIITIIIIIIIVRIIIIRIRIIIIRIIMGIFNAPYLSSI